uniref:Uncharacterized protein n=1 Tax=Arundo donax TaxID=35708 RepID=A0A0A9FH79_ARUDO
MSTTSSVPSWYRASTTGMRSPVAAAACPWQPPPPFRCFSSWIRSLSCLMYAAALSR